MIAGLEAALTTDGIAWILLATVIAGLVRGFAGFGAGMIFIPIVGIFVDPITVIVALQVADGIGSLPLVPRGFRDGEPRSVVTLLIPAVIVLPFGVYLLENSDGEVFRWIIAILILCLLGLLISGWRYRDRLSRAMTLGVGTVSGLMSGYCGLAGPPVILMYMSGPYRASVIRGNIIQFFFILTSVGFATLVVRGLMTAERVWLGLLLTGPYLVAIMLGARVFRPEQEQTFRVVAYVIILAAVILSLPLWS